MVDVIRVELEGTLVTEEVQGERRHVEQGNTFVFVHHVLEGFQIGGLAFVLGRTRVRDDRRSDDDFRIRAIGLDGADHEIDVIDVIETLDVPRTIIHA